MTESRKIFSNTLVVGAGQVLNMLLNFLTMILLARSLDQEHFGLFSYALIFVGYFAILPDFGMKPTIVREVARHKNQADHILTNALFLKGILSLLAMGASFLAARGLGYSSQLVRLVLLMSFNILISSKLTAFRIVFEAPFETRLDMGIPMLIRLADSLLQFGLVFWGIRHGVSLMGLTGLYIAGFVPGFLVMGMLFRSRITWRHVNWAMMRSLLIQSFPIALYVVCIRLFMSAEFFFLKAWKSEYELGIYAAAYRLIAPLDFIPAALLYSLYPLLSRIGLSDQERTARYVRMGMKVLLMIGLLMAVWTSFHARTLIRWVYSEKYLEAAPSLVLLAWVECFYFLVFFLVDLNNATHRQTLNAWLTFSMMVLHLFFNLLLIPRLPVYAAALSKWIAVGIGLLLFYRALPIRSLLSARAMLFKTLGIGGLLTAGLWMGKGLPFLFTPWVALALAWIGIRIFGFLDAEERMKLLEMWRR